MDDKDFLLIKTLYEEKNITHAAKRLYISQPAISDRLKRLETEFGCQLFIRQPRGILFTSQGEQLVQYVTRADADYQKLRKQLSAPTEEIYGNFSIACSDLFARHHLSPLLQEFKRKYPAVTLTITSGFSTPLYREFLEGRYPVCIVRGEHNWAEHKKRLIREPICLFSKDPVEMKSLPQHPFIRCTGDPSLESLLDEWWYAHYKEPPCLAARTASVETCLKLVSTEIGFTFLSESCGHGFPGLCSRPLTSTRGIPLQRDTWLYYRKNYQLLPGLRAFIQYIESHFDEN